MHLLGMKKVSNMQLNVLVYSVLNLSYLIYSSKKKGNWELKESDCAHGCNIFWLIY